MLSHQHKMHNNFKITRHTHWVRHVMGVRDLWKTYLSGIKSSPHKHVKDPHELVVGIDISFMLCRIVRNEEAYQYLNITPCRPLPYFQSKLNYYCTVLANHAKDAVFAFDGDFHSIKYVARKERDARTRSASK